MSSSTLRIRIRCPSVSPAPVQVEGCTAQTTFAEFQGLVLRALGLESDDPDRQQAGPTILAGFPPRPLDLPEGAQIGSALSDNENVTVRLATQSAGGANPEGGKWGGRGRAKRPAASTASSSFSSSSTRSSTRASKSSSARATAAAEEGMGAGEGADADGDYIPPSITEEPKAKPKPKPKPKAKGKASEKKPAATGSSSSAKNKARAANRTGGNSSSSSSSSGSGRGVHTLAGPLAPPPSRPAARSPTGLSGGSSRAGPARGSLPGQVNSLFGSATARGGGGGATRSAAATGPVAAAAGGADGPSRKRARGGKEIALKSEGDISECLLQAVGGGGKGVADRFFRKAMKLAVDKQYDQSRADARVRAALGGWYTAETSTTQRRLADGESVSVKISFSKGDGAKSQLEETVDRIPREQVAAVVGMIARDPESREMLKPHNFAGCSPRMFWSLVEYWGGDIPRALRLAAPSVDWGFVDTRDRKPSEKAVANAQAEELKRLEAEEERARKEEERAQKEKAKKKKARKMERKRKRREGIETDSSEDDEASTAAPTEPPPAEAAAEGGAGMAAVGGSSEAGVPAARLAAAAAADARSRAANAALRRLAASRDRPASGGAATATAAAAALVEAAGAAEAAAATGAGMVAPTIASSVGADKEKGKEEGEEEVDMEGLTEVAGEAGAGLLAAAGVRTIGQLADRDEEELTLQLGALQGGGALPAAGGGGSAGDGVQAEEVAEWVQEARGGELDEIMAEIVGGDDDVVEALEEVAVSTPRDLVRLGAFPDVLVATVKGQVGAERFAELEGRITPQAVEAWRRKGDRLLEQRPWLELWVHEG